MGTYDTTLAAAPPPDRAYNIDVCCVGNCIPRSRVVCLYRFVWGDFAGPADGGLSMAYAVGDLGDGDYYHLHYLPDARRLEVLARTCRAAMQAATTFAGASVGRPDAYEAPVDGDPPPPDWAECARHAGCAECRGAGVVMEASGWAACGLCAARRRMES